MTLGEKIKQARLNKGYTQEELASLLNTAKQTIWKYENEVVTNLPIKRIKELADALNISPGYLMGWEDTEEFAPVVTDDVVSFRIVGDVAAGYDHVAYTDWEGAKVDIPRSYLHGRPQSDYFVLRVVGDSMYPMYMDGDIVLVLRQTTMNRSGDIGVVIYDSDCATLKRIDYVMGEDWMKLTPINPTYPPITIKDEELEKCKVLGIPTVVIREVK